jgi:hypothetical protein
MIIQKDIKINDDYFTYTYSSNGNLIEREGEMYVDALDPRLLGRTYNETDIPLSEEERNTLFITQEIDLISIV